MWATGGAGVVKDCAGLVEDLGGWKGEGGGEERAGGGLEEGGGHGWGIPSFGRTYIEDLR